MCAIVQADQSDRMKGRVPKSASGFLRRDILEISTNPRQQSIVDQICPVGSLGTHQYFQWDLYMIITFFPRPAVATVSEVGSVTSVVAASASAIPTVTTTILLLLYWSWLEKF